MTSATTSVPAETALASLSSLHAPVLALVLVGGPGAGKSFFAERLTRAQPGRWQWVESDTFDGATSSAWSNVAHQWVGIALAASDSGGRGLILDRCNVARVDRRQYIEQLRDAWSAAHMSAASAARSLRIECLYFDVPVAVAQHRVLARASHATLSQAKIARKGGADYVLKVLQNFYEHLDEPSEREGFDSVRTIASNEDWRDTMIEYGVSALSPWIRLSDLPPAPVSVGSQPPQKFPRTPHLFDTGGTAVSADDLVIDDAAQVSAFYGAEGRVVHVQEKVDGCNLGLSIDPASGAIVAHSRSHWVNARTHQQFANLEHWIDTNESDLRRILAPPDRYVLYGEWCRAQHSIHYTALPDYFLAFDLLDRRRGRFVSVSRMRTLLTSTRLALVPLITSRSFHTAAELRALLETPSAYHRGAVEGVYLRVDDESDQWLEHRTKLVHPDFLAGIDRHWTKKSKLVKNIVDYSLMTRYNSHT